MEYQIYNEDCIEGAKKRFDAESADVLLCDPPFGINEITFDNHYKRKEDGLVIDGYVEAPSDYYTFTYAWMEQAKRILKKNGSFFIVSGWSNLKDILLVGDQLGLYLVNHIIWKYNFGVYTKSKFVTSHYHILYYTKNKNTKRVFNQYCRFGPDEKDDDGKSLLYADMEDVWIINKEFHQGRKKNKNKLPDALVEKILLYSTNENDVVCDFFQGNFTTAKVSARLGRIPTGFELNKEAYNYNMPLLNEIEFGIDLKTLKQIVINIPANQGKRVTKEERESINVDCMQLLKEGRLKKDVIKILCEKYGRGKFSIINILDI